MGSRLWEVGWGWTLSHQASEEGLKRRVMGKGQKANGCVQEQLKLDKEPKTGRQGCSEEGWRMEKKEAC